MKITFIGCGDAFSDKLGNNSALLEFNDTNLLIDIPDSNYSRIKNTNKEYSDIENIFITHLHADHINGLERFAYYRKYATPVVRPNEKTSKPNLFIPETIYNGIWDSVKHGLGITTDGTKRLEDYFNVHLVNLRKNNPSFTINNVEFFVTNSNHVPNMDVYGLYVPKEFYYSADSVYDDSAILNYLYDVKKIFHDIHFFDAKIPVHASIRDFYHWSKKDKEKIFAMHYDDSKVEFDIIDGIKLVKPYKSIEI